MRKNDTKIVIVGAGMAGLTAAAYLLKAGFDVLLLEKNDRTGGLLSTLKYDHFCFDTGPRALVNSGIVKPILKELGIELNYCVNKISIGIEDQFFQVNSIKDLKEYQRILTNLFPENQEEIKHILAAMNDLSE